MNRIRTNLVCIAALACSVAGLAACGSDDVATTTTPSTSPAVPATPAPTPAPTTPPTTPPTTAERTTVPPTAPPTTIGGGGMQAGAPRFMSFDVSPSVQCQAGNATAQMSFSTINVVEIEIKIGNGRFETTAGYGPNETSVVASIPCNGAGTSSVQLRGCTESHDCVDSAQQPVEITA